jgi:two-component system response regulator FlrC
MNGYKETPMNQVHPAHIQAPNWSAATANMLASTGNLLTSQNPAMRRVLALATGVSATPTTVLLTGESGTGKEVLARTIHAQSDCPDGPFVAINCAAIPGSLMESELFGHEKGAFSGATERKDGKFELANGGTLLLDEVSELPMPLQAKLLRVLQERQVCRIGGNRVVNLNVRIIATTNRDLRTMVREGTFRQDLYYRINVFPIELPNLRDRRVDIRSLSDVIIARLVKRIGRGAMYLSEPALRQLERHPFPGNVRELQNILERAVILTNGPTIDTGALLFDDDQPSVQLAGPTPMMDFAGQTLAEIERQVILRTLADLQGNRTRTSQQLGISIRTLRNRLRGYRGAGYSIPEASIGFAA